VSAFLAVYIPFLAVVLLLAVLADRYGQRDAGGRRRGRHRA
jgi:hypothetical protein